MATVLVTGGAGFIGSAFVRLLRRERPNDLCVTVDALTYAGSDRWVRELSGDTGHVFRCADICDRADIERICRRYHVESIVNFAAESHVARSILDPALFARTNIMGTVALLDAARACGVRRFLQVSTDEVYGEVLDGSSAEADPLAPRNPYAASKAAAEHMALSYWHTYGLQVVVTRGGNNYGPRQYPEKLIPATVARAFRGEPLLVHGDGSQVRDWIHVEDHCSGILAALERGEPGTVYNVSAGELRTNLAVVRAIAAATGTPESRIVCVGDRPAQDRRYSLNAARLRSCGWAPRRSFEPALPETIRWYAEHRDWCDGAGITEVAA